MISPSQHPPPFTPADSAQGQRPQANGLASKEQDAKQSEDTPPIKKIRGRPKGSKNRSAPADSAKDQHTQFELTADIENTKKRERSENSEDTPPPRKRGRPKGSKNKKPWGRPNPEKVLEGLGDMLRWHFDEPPPPVKAVEKKLKSTVKKRKDRDPTADLCKVEGCTKSKSFGFPGGPKIRCKQHADPGMIGKKAYACQVEGCNVSASLGWATPEALKAPHITPPTHCSAHAQPGQVNLVNRRCTAPGCLLIPSFCWPGQKATRCKSHADEGMIRRSKGCCTQPGCQKKPSFGILGQGPPLRCSLHAEPGMQQMGVPRCEKCGKSAYYGFHGERARKRYCREHKEPGMVNLSITLCKVENCSKEATYGLEGGRAIRCKLHLESHMVDVRNKRCEFPDCEKQARFKAPEGRIQYCKLHKLPGYKDGTKPGCQVEGCYTSAGFGWQREDKILRTRCMKHKEPGMVSISEHPCAQQGCVVNGRHKVPGADIWYCTGHTSVRIG